MIFDCPSCGAENGVPVSEIPPDGHILMCRECRQPYRVLPPEDEVDDAAFPDSETAIDDAEGDEKTLVGMVRTALDGEGPVPTSIADDGPALFTPEASTHEESAVNPIEAGDADPRLNEPQNSIERGDEGEEDLPTMTGNPSSVPEETGPIDSWRAGTIPIDPKLTAVAAGNDDLPTLSMPSDKLPTLNDPAPERFGSDGTTRASAGAKPSIVSMSPEIQRREDTPKNRTQDSGDILVRPARPSSAPDLYSRLAEGEAPKPRRQTKDDPLRRAETHGKAKAWNEASVAGVPPGRGSALRLAQAINRVPLALRVAAVVFILTLSGVLAVTAPGDDAVPIPIAPLFEDATPKTEVPHALPEAVRAEIEVPAAKEEAPAAKEEAPAANEEAPAAKEEALDDPALDRAPAIDVASRLNDVAAPEGWAYVKVEAAEISVRPAAHASIVARTRSGSLLKTYEKVGEWMLVRVPPKGAAGFIRAESLSPRKPLSALARELAFDGCDGPHPSLEGCLDRAEARLDACLASCAGASASVALEPDFSSRCEQACRIASQDCVDGCRRKPKRIRKRR